MRGLTRLIMMFAPMIINQVQRYQRNKQRKQDRRYQQPPERQYGNRNPRNNRYDPAPVKTPPPPPKPKKPELTEDEKNYKLKEEEIMIDPKILDNYTEKNYRKPQMPEQTQIEKELPSKPQLENPIAETKSEPIKKEPDTPPDPDSDLDLRDIFFNEETEES